MVSSYVASLKSAPTVKPSTDSGDGIAGCWATAFELGTATRVTMDPTRQSRRVEVIGIDDSGYRCVGWSRRPIWTGSGSPVTSDSGSEPPRASWHPDRSFNGKRQDGQD